MSDGDFPFRSFTVRAEGYDRPEVDAYIAELQGEITRLRRALDAYAGNDEGDIRLHDPEGAVTRTLAIAQETADRVLHDAQVEADRRRSDADEKAATTVADAEGRAAKMMADIETQTAEVRAQGIAAARAAIQVERDKAVSELGEIRRVRDDIRAEAVELKSVLDGYRSQAREAADTLGSAAAGPLLTFELPDYVAADVALAGVVDEGELSAEPLPAPEPAPDWRSGIGDDAPAADSGAVGADKGQLADPVPPAPMAAPAEDASVPAWTDESVPDAALAPVDAPGLADVISIGGDEGGDAGDLPSDLDEGESGAFLAEVRAAADDPVALAPEGHTGDDSDRFLNELRGAAESATADDADDDQDPDGQ